MHGVIFRELEKYAETRLGAGGWGRLLADAELGGRVYNPCAAHEDGEAVRLIRATAARSGKSVQETLEDFGAFLVPDLMRLYGRLMKPEWKTLEVLENTEEVIHTVVRNAGASPPPLVVARRGPDLVSIRYASSRRMCGLATGIIRGLAVHFGEHVLVSQPRCMLRGDATCELLATRTPSSSLPQPKI